jgi:multidrug efflux pump subunit AcrA (membrane-fusion protein)
VAREKIAGLRSVRAEQTVAVDVATAYLNVLLARASRRVQEDAVRLAESILADTRARRKGDGGPRRRAAGRGAGGGQPQRPGHRAGDGTGCPGPAEQHHGAERGEEHARVAAVRAQLAEARLNLEWTRIYAPCNGYVTNVQLREGFYIHVGTPVLTLIDSDNWWVVANYRENSLENIRPCQPVRLTMTNFPNRRRTPHRAPASG